MDCELVAQPEMADEKRIERRSQTMVTNQPTRAEITDFGSVRRIVGPPGWTKVDETPQGMTTRASFAFRPTDATDVAITLYYRGQPVNETSADYFSRLLEKPLESNEQYALQPEIIRALKYVLGLSTIGDNQITNSAPKATHLYPVFSIQTADLVQVNGRTVLKVVGTFQSDKGLPTNEYQGYFFPSKNDPAQIEEIFFQAPTRGKFLRYIAQFEQTLKTVEWHY